MRKDFSGDNALIYDETGELLASVNIIEHDTKENAIEVRDLPTLVVGDPCRVLILTAPAPYEYRGIIRKRARSRIITLYKGEVKENRKEDRYKIDAPARVEGLICEGKVYPLHTAVKANLINISKGGMRLRAEFNALTDGAEFQLRLMVGEIDKLLNAKVVRRDDASPDYSEFSCRLLTGEVG